jgi:tetratricopeptide (TPR) repeat protein
LYQRPAGSYPSGVTLTHCIVDLARCRVSRDGQLVELTAREADLLRYLSENPSRTVSREELLSCVWGYADTVVSRACDNTVRRLREKIEGDASRPDHVLTVHGVGYRFEPGAPAAAEAWTQLGPLRVDLGAPRIDGPRGERSLTAPEAGVLGALMRARGAVVPADARAVHGLRRKLGPDVPIDTVRGGYRLVLPQAPAPPREVHPHGLVGRDRLLQEGRELGAQAGWLLLVGPAGAGKSRLARELAPQAVWVDLAAAETPEAAAARVARALSLEPGGEDTIEQVGQRLERRASEVVLDNLEQLAEGAVRLVERWSRPGVRLIGTSRRRIGARGEVVIEVGPLALDDAIALFEARAAAASPAFRAAPADRQAIGELVDRIDRFPLAIELLAARTTVLGLEDLRRRVGAELLVQAPGRDPRHHSVEALVQASIAALPAPAQADLAQLALFRSGFSVDDAEAVLGPDAVDRLQVLRDHCLLRRLPDRLGHARFDTWQLVHEMLDRAPDPARTRRYCERMARWGDRPEDILRVGAEAELDEIAACIDELVRAADSALVLADPALAARCAVPAMVVLTACGPFAAGLALADRVLAAGPPDAAAAQLQFSRAHLLRMVGRVDEAVDAVRTLLDAAERADLPALVARGWTTLGTLEIYYALPGARSSLERGQQAWGRLLDPCGWDALCEARLRWLGGDNAGARTAARTALARGRERGDRQLILMTATLLGDEAAMDGRLTEAAAVFDIELQAAHFALHRLIALGHRMDVALNTWDAETLEPRLAEFAAAAAPLASRVADAWLLRGRAALAGLRGRWEEACRALDEAEALQEGLGSPRDAMILQMVRTELARRRGDPQAALAAARHLRSAFAHVDPSAVAVSTSEIGLALLASGDVAGSRAALQGAAPCAWRMDLPLRLAWQALLAAAEGDRGEASRQLEALRTELQRGGWPAPDDDGARLAAVLGPWAAERLAGTNVPGGTASSS